MLAAGCNPFYKNPSEPPSHYCDPCPCDNGNTNPTPKNSTQNQTPTTPTGWQTYTNTDWSFTFFYPAKYQIVDNHFKKELPYYKDLVNIVTSIPPKGSEPALTINVVNTFGELHPKYITDIYEYVTSAYDPKNNQITKILINGNSGYQIDFLDDPNLKPHHIVLQDKNKVIFDLFLPADNTELNAIAQTFQFTQ